MQEHSWGSKVVDQLAGDLRRAFSDMKGLSPRNLRYMRSFAEAWSDASILQAPLAKLTWCHNIALLEKLTSSDIRLWYAQPLWQTKTGHISFLKMKYAPADTNLQVQIALPD